MPNSNIVSAKGAGLASGGSAAPEAYNSQDYNAFDRSMTAFQTQRFADINPIFAKKFISGDRVRIRSGHELRTYTLKSPLMSKVYMHRAFFSVPLQCIYHNTFKPFFVNPVKGNDIPDSVLGGFPLSRVRGDNARSLYLRLSSDMSNIQSGVSDGNSIKYLKQLFLLIQMFSKDGLLQKLGYSISGLDVDYLVDLIMQPDRNAQDVTSFKIGYKDNAGRSCYIDTVTNVYSNSISIYTMPLKQKRSIVFDLINNKYEITSFMSDCISSQDFVSEYSTLLNAIPNYSSDEYVNLEKVIAYQYVCAQYYTNSFVDDIHDAFSWEQNIMTTYRGIIQSTSATAIKSLPVSFTLNGVNYNYDLVNRQTLDNLCFIAFYQTGYDAMNVALDLLRNIFEVHYSLRTQDYFLDSRTQPLAVGDVYASVTNNQVSAIDVNISLWKQRFLNAVNRIPYHIENYLNGIFGFTPETKEPKPYYLHKERFLISGQEIENTANDTGKVVTNLRTEDSRFIFESKTSEPCIILGLSSYSLEYAYSTAMDKEFVEFDRFDNFNPFLQHAGDQPLLARELDNNPSRFTLSTPFAYQVRYQQYKKSINHASGGFLDSLPSWVALYDKTGNFGANAYLNPDFIRNHNLDFDDFYGSLTGSDPLTYFHFICRFDTICHVNSKQQKYPSLM